MLNQQQPKGRWVYSYTLSRHIFIDEKRRIIDPNVALLKSNVIPQPFVADPALQFVQQNVVPFQANTYICNNVANKVVETKQSDPEVIWSAPNQPVEEKNSTMVPELPNQQPAQSVNFTSNDAGLEEKETIRVPLHAPRVKPAMKPVTPRYTQPQVQKSPQREEKEVATASPAPIAAVKSSTPKATTTVKVDNTGADNPPKNQSTKSKNEWSTVKSRKKFTPREDRDSSPSKKSTLNDSRKGGYRNRRYMSRSKLLGRNWRDIQEAAHRRAAAPSPAPQKRAAAPTPTRNTRNDRNYRPAAQRRAAAPRAPAPTPTRRAPRRQYVVPANATKLEPPITLDKLQGEWINSRNEEVTVRGQHYSFTKYGAPYSSGYFDETDEEFLVNGWILQKSGNVVLWYKPRNENITWRRIGGDASATPVNSAASEARDYASTRPNCKVVHLTCRTDLRSGCNMASRKVKNFEKDEPLVVDTSTLCTLGANDNNIVRIKVVFPCEGWISKFQKNGSPTYSTKGK